MKNVRNQLVALAVGLSAVACVFVSSSGTPTDRPDTLRDSAELVIVPGYRALASDAVQLRETLDDHCAAPDEESLASARAMFLVTSRSWSRTLPWSFGPLLDERLEGEISFWPIRVDTIEANVASDAAIDEAWVASLGVAGKGLPVLEYLIFESDATVSDPRRCAYAAALGAYLATTTERLVGAWDPTYADAFATAGRGSDVYRSQLDAFSAMLTRMIASVQSIKLTRLGGPLGYATGGTPQPGGVELPYSHASLAAMIATLEGLRALWRVEGGNGLEQWVSERAPALASRVLAEIDDALATLRAVPEPLGEYVAGSDHAAGDAAYDALRRLERSLATDVSGALAIAVMFTDNDGD